jgi:protein phosphatase
MALIRPRAVDILKLALSPEQGFVLSRIDHPMSVSELSAQSGIEEVRLHDIIVHLASQGAVDLEGAMPAAPPGLDVTLRGICDVGRNRTNNEDALTVDDLTDGGGVPVLDGEQQGTIGPGGLLLAVSDGMGGENAGEVASAMVLEALREHLCANATNGDPTAALAAAVHHANARVFAAASEPGKTGMGATLVAVMIVGTTAITAEVGDSRIYLLRNGMLSQVSKDQTHIQLLIQSGLATADLLQSRAKNIILQACGKEETLIVAQRRFSLCDGDRILLCSDGLTLHVEDSEIGVVLAQGDSLACETLVNLANDRGGKDNVTVLVATVASGAPDGGSGIEVIREYAVGEQNSDPAAPPVDPINDDDY